MSDRDATSAGAAIPVIRTPDQRLRVFVSSTLAELADERAVVSRAISAIGLTPVLFELGARPHPPQDLYRAYLAQSDIFVGIYWQKYGWVGPGMDISGLEDEFRLSASMPRLLYVKRPAPDREPGLTAMIETLQTEGTDSYRSFSTLRELGRLVRDDLAVLLSERFAAGAGAGLAAGVAGGGAAGQSASPSSSLGSASGPASVPGFASSEPAEPMGPAEPVAPAHRSLPSPTTTLFGREDDIAAVAALLAEPDVRLVTLTGPGGIGKTRLAVAVGERVEREYPAGVVFVPLSSIDEPDLVMPRVAAAVGAPIEGTRPPLDAVVEELGDSSTLLVLDNLEQVVDVAPSIDELLARCPNVAILGTSRTVLRLRAEREYPVAPLALPAGPDPADRPSFDALSASPAVELFVDRARAVSPDFSLTDDNASAVAEICRRLDGLPLAIELAAARTRLLDPVALLGRLEKSLDALGSGPIDLPERQRTLRATVEWSVGLLDDAERQMLAALSVFVDGWTIEAAVPVGGFDEDRTLDLLDALVGHSLVQVAAVEGERRFRMLHAVRDLAAEIRTSIPELGDVEARHTAYFRDYAADADWTRPDVGPAASAARLQAEEGNLRAAVRWFLANDVTPLPSLFLIMWMYWWLCDHMVEGRGWVRELEKRADALTRPDRAELALMVCMTAVEVGDDAAAVAAAGEIERLHSSVDDPYLASVLQLARSWVLPLVDDYAGAREAASVALDGLRQSNEPLMTCGAYNTLGAIEAGLGQYDEALQHFSASIELSRQLGSNAQSSIARAQLADIAVAQGRFDEARTLVEEALDIPDIELSTHVVTFCLVTLAHLAMADGDARRAALAMGAAIQLRERAGLRVWTTARQSEDDLLRRVEQALDPSSFADAFAAGSNLTRRDAFALLRG